MRAHAPKRLRPQTQEDWDLATAQLAKIGGPMSAAVADALHVTMNSLVIVGLGIGPFLGGFLFDHTGNYRALLLLTAPLYAVSAVAFGTLGHLSETSSPTMAAATEAKA